MSLHGVPWILIRTMVLRGGEGHEAHGETTRWKGLHVKRRVPTDASATAAHSPRSRCRRPARQIVMLELTDFLWFLSGILSMCPGAFFDKLNHGVDTFGGAVFGIPNWGSRR